MPATATNLDNITDSEQALIDRSLRQAAGDYTDEADQIVSGMPSGWACLFRRWILLDPIKHAGLVAACIKTPQTTSGKGENKRVVDLPPQFDEDPCGRVFAGVSGLAVDEAGPHCLTVSNIWEPLLDNLLVDCHLRAMLEAVSEGAGSFPPIVAAGVEKIRKTAFLHAATTIPKRAAWFIAFQDGMGWDLSDSENPVIRQITPADGIRRACAMSCPLVPACDLSAPVFGAWVDGDDHSLLSRWVGASACGGNKGKHVLILEGLSDAGKGQLVRSLTDLIWGKCGSLRTKHLAGRFELGRCVGYDVVLDPDASPDALSDDGAYLIKVISGGDEIDIEYKGSNSHRQHLFSSHVILCANYPLYVASESGGGDGFKSRLIRIMLSPPEKKVLDFAKRWKEAAAGIFPAFLVRAAIEARKELEEHGHLVLTDDQSAAVEELTGASSERIIKSFVTDCFKPSKLHAHDRKVVWVKDRFKAWAKTKKMEEKQAAKISGMVCGMMLRLGYSRGSGNQGIRAEWVDGNPF